jgi:O-antigen ligase
MMNVCLFMSIGMAILTKKWALRWFCILTAIFTVVVNAYTGCRGGFMGLIAGLIVFVLLGIFNSKIGRKIPFTLTVFFLICVGVIAYWVSHMESLVITSFGREFDLLNPQETDTFSWRMDTIRAGWDAMNESSAWVWGMGVGAWEYLQEELMGGSTWAHFIHNFYFNWFFQYGAIGSVIMVWLFARVFMPIVHAYKWFTDYRTRWSLNCLIALYVAMVVHGMVSVEETNSYVWILFATTAVFIDYLKDQHDKGLPANAKI